MQPRDKPIEQEEEDEEEDDEEVHSSNESTTRGMMIQLPRTSEEVYQPSMFKGDHFRVRCRHQQNTVAGGHCRKCMEIEERRLLRNRQKARERRKRKKERGDNVKTHIEELEQQNEELRAKNEGLVRELNELDAPLILGPLRSGQRGVDDAMLNLALLKRTEDGNYSDTAAPRSKEEPSAATTSTASTSNGSSLEQSLSAYRGGGLGVSTFNFSIANQLWPTNCDPTTQQIASIFLSARTARYRPEFLSTTAAASYWIDHVRSTTATIRACCLWTISSAATSVLL